MAIIKFKRFTKPHVLRRLGRPLLARFLAQFAPQLAAQTLSLPAPALPDGLYFQALARLLMSPEGLTEPLNEALFAIDEMATPEGQQRLETAIAQSGLALRLQHESSPADVALQVWMAAPALLARLHNEQRLLRLAAFEYFGAQPPKFDPNPNLNSNPPPRPAVWRTTGAGLDICPAPLIDSLDQWFARHQRGRQTARLEVYPLAGEFWFLVRHGDNFTRAPKVEGQLTEVLHFRPEKDDVIVYSPAHDELRLNARTKGEKELYRRQFGLHLGGSEDYFSEGRTYTLEPLRKEGADALDAAGLEGISQITLRELEVSWDNGLHHVLIRQADDLFQCPSCAGSSAAIPPNGRLARAGFLLLFEDSAKPRPVQIQPPNILKLGRHCDALAVDRWLSMRGFRIRG